MKSSLNTGSRSGARHFAATVILGLSTVSACQAGGADGAEQARAARPTVQPAKTCNYGNGVAEIDVTTDSGTAFGSCYYLHNDPALIVRGFKKEEHMNTACAVKLDQAAGNAPDCQAIPAPYSLRQNDHIRINEWDPTTRELVWKRGNDKLVVPLDNTVKKNNETVAWWGQATTPTGVALVYYVYLVDTPTSDINRKSKAFGVEVYLGSDARCPRPATAEPIACQTHAPGPLPEKQGSSGGGGEPPPK